MWQAPGEGKRWALTVCPSRLLSEHPEAGELVEWWMGSTPFDGSGAAAGPPEWPFRGGYFRQPAKLVQAAKLLRGEWAVVVSAGRDSTTTSAPAAREGRQR